MRGEGEEDSVGVWGRDGDVVDRQSAGQGIYQAGTAGGRHVREGDVEASGRQEANYQRGRGGAGNQTASGSVEVIAELEDAGMHQLFVVVAIDADGVIMAAGLEEEVLVIGEGLVHDGGDAIDISEGGFGAQFAIGEEFGEFFFAGQLDFSGAQLTAEGFEINLAAGGQDAHVVFAVGLDDDGFSDVHAGDVFFGGHLLGGEDGAMGEDLVANAVFFEIIGDFHDGAP